MNNQQSFNQWLSSVLTEEPPAAIIAFNFNISEAITHYAVEVCGANQFDIENEDWACDESWTCRPSEYEIPFNYFDSSWEKALEGLVQLVRGYLETPSPGANLLKNAQAIAIGFVDGELVYVKRPNKSQPR